MYNDECDGNGFVVGQVGDEEPHKKKAHKVTRVTATPRTPTPPPPPAFGDIADMPALEGDEGATFDPFIMDEDLRLASRPLKALIFY